MKSILFILSATLVAHSSFGQMKHGKIVYERKINMHKRLTGPQESMRNMVPEFATAKMQLLFSQNESMFKQLEEEEDIRDQAGEAEDERRIVRMGGDNEVYKNYAIGNTIELRELGPKKYIIEDSMQRVKWKLDVTESKLIKGFSCKKATAKNLQGMEMVAWYTGQIICPSGPENYGGLPGMILELNIGEGEIVFTTLEVTDKGNEMIVKAPANGKKISRKEFLKMMEEQFGESGTGGGPVIRIQRN